MTRGFTLIELVVVTGIIALISGLILANYNGFGGSVLLQNLAYDIALSLRQSQEHGISVSSYQGNFGAPYGMHFQTGGAGSSIYVLFADVNGNGLYDTGELVQSTTVGQGYQITNLCAPIDSTNCASTLDITFKRPEPDACIGLSGVSPVESGVCTGGIASASIEVTSPQGQHRDIFIWVNGEISVQ